MTEQPDLSKKSGSSGQGGPQGAPQPPEFGSPFDYDATADASMTESTSGTSSVPPSGGSTAGPGWDTYSGVGNGPGWGSGPSYPSPVDDQLPPASWPVEEPPQYGASAAPPPPVYPPASAYPSAPGYPAPGVGNPAPYGGYGDPSAPFGRDPMTGEPYSGKSRATAGLLQILLGFISLPGIGRLYIGSIGIGLIQLLVFWLGLLSTVFGIGFVIFPVIWIWAFVDGILMLTGAVRDPQGRPLKT
ncbi:TM2 domain-containing membrane protein YozV [Rhodococcus sp. OK519]|uniref:TM2 domain-containing protein n=1 Tax=Rhodococcus sp. OK519 TaxID=2135729 RepID=UPI000D39C877|nr:TM2 domain-containing membrane protein YozV [Rhodococcus sp. OK519]